ncbi:uncharacterized protein KRP23_7592 [Phytophthora ramorum]|uniref:uncharacterized protein n=1 Tax=Phytophthora ramorum TaxID=164328 RepID=UPI003098FF8C|nr:hypothetical protein KRP23_7592 [Phytophthora ramorum]
MEAAEKQLARALTALIEREFPLSRGRETRLDAYLQLEELLRLEDSEASVVELQRQVPTLLREFRFDLQQNSLSDVLQVALRCLSYLMHHRSFAASFSDDHVAFFLGELVRLLFATPDQNTYKLCLWCLTVQNFPRERHKFLPRTVEGLVQAVVNPFKSRAIEVQALKGLLLLLVKYPEQVGVDGAVLGIWVRPIASRLSSSELLTRTQARLLLEEASKHLSEWSDETKKMVQDCAVKYLFPVMKRHMDHDHLKDAMQVWQLTMVLLRSRFAADLGMLNQVLDLQTAVLHSKSKLFDHITRRMDYLKEMYVQCATVLMKWEESEADEAQVKFSSKANLLPYVAVSLLFDYAVFVDDMNNDHGDGKQCTLKYLEVVIRKLVESAKSCNQQCSPGLESVIRFCEDAVRAAHELIDEDLAEGQRSMLVQLAIIAKKLTVHTYESQQNASLLLDLQQPRTSVAIPATASTANDSSDTEEKRADVVVRESEYVSASLDTSTSSPCLLSGEVRPSESPIDPSPASSVDEQPKDQTMVGQSPDRGGTLGEAGKTTGEQVTETYSAKPQALPFGSQSAPPQLTTHSSRGTQRPSVKEPQCVYPDLVGCTEAIASLYRHFPMGFRPFFSFYKVKTIGDLSALPVERVRTFGLKEPVSTVRRALEEFNGRKDRMKSLNGSPFRQRSGSTSTSPAIPTPSPHKPPKRSFQLDSVGAAPLALEVRQHKRTKRSLVLDGGDVEEESENTRRKPKLADRVTFCLQSGETGETRITRPGEDSQDQLKPSEKLEEKESVQEKMDTYTLKLLQHLRRSAYYIDKLVTEEESMQSEEASLQTSIATVGGVITNYQEAHDLVSRLASQLQVAAETSSKRCRKLLDK